jgi:polynucleotide 5'-kinase involved in rRNA processing
LVQTLENETIDADIGEESYLVSQSIALAKPLGYLVIHSTVAEYFFTFDSPSLGVLDEFRWG